MRLTPVALDIVAAIGDVREPRGLSLEQLVKEMPTMWEERRRRFGFGA